MSDGAWYRERLPALADSSRAPELVLLHGWAASSEVWRPWLPRLRQRSNVTLLDLPGFGRSAVQPELTLDGLLAQLHGQVPEGAVMLGWSLGGMLAVAFTERYPERCSGLMTIAANPCFVARPEWPSGMSAAAFADFVAAATADPLAAHRRFQGLQARGGEDERTLLRWLRREFPQPSDPSGARWGLQLLAELDVRSALRAWRGPALHIYGSRDALVPAATAQATAQLVPDQWVMLLDGISHLPFASEPELLYHHVARILSQSGRLLRWRPPRRDKLAVARAFSRAAASYDSVAGLQRQVADELRARMRAAHRFPRTDELWLDLGSGTGSETVALLTDTPHDAATVIALDVAEGMATHARHTWPLAPIRWLCGDAESLPLAGDSLHGVFSSLAMQWCEHPAALFAELYRVLKPGGRAWIATLGPATLHELEAAWRAVDDRVHVNDFAAREELERAIGAAGLQVRQWQEEPIVLEYPELNRLTRELKTLGAGNVNQGRPGGLGGRARLLRLREAYDRFRNERGLLPATWQVWYLELKKDV